MAAKGEELGGRKQAGSPAGGYSKICEAECRAVSSVGGRAQGRTILMVWSPAAHRCQGDPRCPGSSLGG